MMRNRIERIRRYPLWVPMVDGGWGWIVCIGSFLVHVFADGITYSFGSIYPRFKQDFGASEKESAFVGALLVGMTLTVGLLASAVANKWGCRITTIFGSIIATIGALASYQATSVYYLMGTVGVVMGFGIGFMYCPAIIIVTVYFEKKRAMATGIAVCGAGIGTLLVAPLATKVALIYGWRSVFFLYAGVLVLCAFCGTTFRPLPFVKVEDEEEQKAEVKDDGIKLDFLNNLNGNGGPKEFESKALLDRQLRPYLSHNALNSPLGEQRRDDVKKATSLANISARPMVLESTGFLNIKDVFYTGSVTALPNENKEKYRSLTNLKPEKDGALNVGGTAEEAGYELEQEERNRMREILRGLSKMMDWSLLADPVFLLFAISNFFTSIGFNAPLIFLPKHTEDLGNSEADGGFTLSAFGACNTIGRLVFGFVSDRQLPFRCGKDLKRNRLWIYNLSLCFCGFITCFVFLCRSYISLLGYAGLFGFSLSSYVTLTSVLLVDLLGLDKLTSGFGLLLLFQGVATFVGPYLAAWLADTMGNYDGSFTFCGVCVLISGAMLFAIPFIQRVQARRQPKNRPFAY